MKGNLFRHIFKWISATFIVVITVSIVIFVQWEMKRIEKSIIDEALLLADLAASQIETGYISGFVPFETIYKIKK